MLVNTCFPFSLKVLVPKSLENEFSLNLQIWSPLLAVVTQTHPFKSESTENSSQITIVIIVNFENLPFL